MEFLIPERVMAFPFFFFFLKDIFHIYALFW